MYVAEEMHDVLGTGDRLAGQVYLDDDSVKTVTDKNQESVQQLREYFHQSPPQEVWLDTESSVRGPVESTRTQVCVAFFAFSRLGLQPIMLLGLTGESPVAGIG